MFESSITSLNLFHRGKVRDTYIVDDDHLLIVATDRLSAFDVVMSQTIPGKGKILTALSRFWFGLLGSIIPNHMTNIDPIDVVTNDEVHQVIDRSLVVKRCRPILIEAVVRGFLSGSAWLAYQNNQEVSGIKLPFGLRHADRLVEPIFTPAKKESFGGHDENISFRQMVDICGKEIAEKIKTISFSLYQEAQKYAETKNILIADTKFEFGLDQNGELMLIDEMFTPDSSRFWAKETYFPDSNPASFDKQPIRDWLSHNSLNDDSLLSTHLPLDVINATVVRYREAFSRLTKEA